MTSVCVVGATGYVGAEVCRWVLGHPDLTLATATSGTHAGKPLSAVHPGLAGCTSLELEAFDASSVASHDLVVLATPHGAAAPLVAQLTDAPCIIDASADHRADPGWIYGPPELVDEMSFAGPVRVACPGCFATSIELALGPLVRAGVVTGPAMIAAATGSTGSGASPKPGTHHPERMVNLKAYKVLSHQHVPEVRRFLDRLGGSPALHFVPWSAPVDRGIFATVFAPVTPGFDARAAFADAYAEAPLVRLRPDTPQLRHVRGTAFADLAVHQADDVATMLVAIDNLGKGAAAQAVQWANRVLGLPQGRGLVLPGALP